MKDYLLKVKANDHISGKLWLLSLEWEEDPPKAGQFFMIEVSDYYDPMGRRAFAVADVRDGEILFFYDVIGRGTKLLSTKRKGDTLRAFGPLGRRLFSYEGEKHLLIGGGVGLAGLTLFGKELRALGKDVLFVYGARRSDQLGMEGWLKEEGFDYVLFTEDGSKGRQGLVTDIFKDLKGSWTVSACGPKGMLRAVKNEALKRGLRAYLSLEERMACGWGVCLGCVVKTAGGKFKRVCWEGPVFPAEEVVFS